MSIPTFAKNIQGNKISEPETHNRNLFLIAAHFWLDKYQKQSSLLRLHLNHLHTHWVSRPYLRRLISFAAHQLDERRRVSSIAKILNLPFQESPHIPHGESMRNQFENA
jgi:hypothetical protein